MPNDSVKMAAVFAAGYLIGRSRKGRLVLVLAGGAVVAGRGVMALGLDQSRLGGALTEVLADVQNSAGKALSARAERLTDSLRSQTERLNGAGEQVTSAGEKVTGAGEKVTGAGERAAGAVGLGRDQDQAEDEAAGADEGPDSGSDSDGEGEDEEPRQTSRRPDRGRATSKRRDREPQAAGRGERS